VGEGSARSEYGVPAKKNLKPNKTRPKMKLKDNIEEGQR
jgi:hypothetical protein